MARRKIATSDIITDIPELEEGQQFARVLGTRGKNVHEVQFSDNQELLVNLPPKFRSLVWVKRGMILVVVRPGCYGSEVVASSRDQLSFLREEKGIMDH